LKLRTVRRRGVFQYGSCILDGRAGRVGSYFSSEAGGSMSRTRVFKSGKSQAIRIPAELAYDNFDIELEIMRFGEVITIFPARESLTDAVAVLRRMPKPSVVEQREPIDVPVRQRE
jgi:antitoxin VapB